MAKIQVYQFGPFANQESASPFCVKVHYAIRYKRVTFDAVNITSPLDLRRLNARGKLPVMVYDGVSVADSTDIIRYLEARHPEPRLYPQDPRARVTALLMEDWADESLYWHVVYERWQVADQFARFAEIVFSPAPAALRPVIKLLVGRQIRGQLRGQGLGRLSLAEQREKLGLALDWLDSMTDGQFLCGEELSVADIAVAAEVAALDTPITPVAQAAVHQRAKLMGWLERTREAVAAKVP
jgi:glutathione S-transferase